MSAAVMNIEASHGPEDRFTHTTGTSLIADCRSKGAVNVDVGSATILARGVAVYQFARVAGQVELEPHAVRLVALVDVIPVVATSGVGIVASMASRCRTPSAGRCPPRTARVSVFALVSVLVDPLREL